MKNKDMVIGCMKEMHLGGVTLGPSSLCLDLQKLYSILSQLGTSCTVHSLNDHSLCLLSVFPSHFGQEKSWGTLLKVI